MKTNLENIKKLLLLSLLSVVFILFSCSNNNEDIDETDENLSEVVMQDFIEDLNSLSVPSGLSSSTNTYAQQAYGQFQSLKSLSSSFTSMFTGIPADATSNKTAVKNASKTAANTKTYTWSSDGVTINYSITEDSNKYSFTYSITSSSYTGIVMDGYQLIDGSYAEVNLYNGDLIYASIKWWITGDTVKIELSTDELKMVLDSNTVDYSGTLKIYYDDELTATYQWAANGSGTYTDHYTEYTYDW